MLACTYFCSEVCVFVKMIQVTKMCESVKVRILLAKSKHYLLVS